MTDAELTQAMAELQEVVRCRCHEAYRDRGLHDPQCECDSAEAVKIVADRIEALTEQLAAARQDAEEAEAYAEELEKRRDVASIWNEAVDEALDILDDEGWLGESRERIELLKKPLGGKDE